jgi:hypothetical protein
MARSTVRFTLRRDEVGKLFKAGGQVYIAAGKFADRVLVGAVAEAPERTGKLKRSLRKMATVAPMGVFFRVGSDLDYAEYVHEGTRAHRILPRGGNRYMVFEVNGRKVFAKEIDHPGTEGDPFLRRALAAEQARGL